MFQLSKKKIIIGIIVWLLCLLLTFILVTFFNKKSTNEFVNLEEEKIENKFKKIDYYGFYNENDLNIIEKSYNNSFEYIQIDGLRNKQIEEKINNEIYSESKNIVPINNEVYANFSNILSIYIGNYEIGYSCLNYDLSTGKKIKFEDLFTDNANISSLLSTAFYNKLSTDYSFNLRDVERAISAYEADPNTCSQSYCGEPIEELRAQKKLYEENLANLEDIVFTKVNAFLKQSDKKFYVTNYSIVIFHENNQIPILIKNNPGYYAYYERYQTNESIFENENIGNKNLFISSIHNSSIKYNKVEYIGDYALIDSAAVDEYPSNIEQKLNKLYEEKINSIDKSKFIYLNVYGGISGNINDSVSAYHITLKKCEMSKDYFNSNFIHKIIEKKETDNMGFNNIVNVDQKDFNVKCEENNIAYVIDSNNNVYENEEIFIDGFNYKEYLNQRYYDAAEKRFWEPITYTDEEKLTHEFVYLFDGAYIDVKLDNSIERIHIDSISTEYLKF